VSQENQGLKAAKSYLLNIYDMSDMAAQRDLGEVTGPPDGHFLGSWQPADAVVILVGTQPEICRCMVTRRLPITAANFARTR
jgi:hypothetical protein